MRSLSDIALSCGYTVISNKAPTVMELAGPGQWSVVEFACRQFVRRPHFGISYDHVSVICRHADGTRDLRDVGINGVRYGKLPGVGFKEKRTYAGSGIRGVRKEGNRYRCLITVHGVKVHIGMYSTMELAGRARDRYVTDHALPLTLNYPEEVTT